ncbi:TatD family hydrolase [Paenibacillus hamazuiensis]|uniref:TatD family hydrolase n=1 Tax=Paenibacillus hamazuiensis TaxID=2936508 RepID=UPI00200D1BFD|nr:TatD family hydrolase [Paenibacillus hamazuiensis]
MREELLASLGAHGVAGVVAVSMHLESCRRLLELKRRSGHPIYLAFGYHPEQALPNGGEVERLFRWIREHRDEMAAIGEVGLPYYLRADAEAAGKPFNQEPYVLMLERFVKLASELDKPIVLHAVYEDADLACDLLEKHGVGRAHFHWFKGSPDTLRRMQQNGYFVSVTPDVVYKERTKSLVEAYPLGLLMAETDDPWPFQGPYEGRRTHPGMIRDSVREIAAIKHISEEEAGAVLLENTRRFYGILHS